MFLLKLSGIQSYMYLFCRQIKFPCTMCTKKYNTKSELEKHIKQVHSLPDGGINNRPGPPGGGIITGVPGGGINTGAPRPGGGVNTGAPGAGGGINTGVPGPEGGPGAGSGPNTQFTQEYKCSRT